LIFQIENKNVHASDAGQGIDSKKDTVIFLHGSGLSHIVWSLSEQFFSNKNFNVLSLDLPGHGNSDGPCLDTIEKIADWIESVLVALDLKTVILIGHSQGCLEILEYAHKYKNRLKKLVFIGGSYRMPVNQDLIDLAKNGDSDAVKLMMKW
jgi:pimeloyl-ACP methyl ester carboxylesterase